MGWDDAGDGRYVRGVAAIYGANCGELQFLVVRERFRRGMMIRDE